MADGNRMLSAKVEEEFEDDIEDEKSAIVCTISRGTYLLEVDVEATQIGATANMSRRRADMGCEGLNPLQWHPYQNKR